RFYYGLAQLYVEAGYYLLELGMIDEGFMHLENAIYYNRYDPSLIQIISQAAEYVDEPQKGIDLLRKLSPYQDSLSINRFIRNLEALESEEN
ncbi:MAG: hypothetical protein JW996_02045, partial [Candidatus Cloacimonetes bacterium]|nr:hypothetical protein [Candidatus Cloacimonadota bacterium]